MTILAAQRPTRRPITVEMYHVMAENGAFEPDDRVELIGGELFDISPIGSLHARCVNYLTRYLIHAAGNDYIIRIQNPIILGDLSEPQPDLSIAKYRSDFYVNGLPEGNDVKIVIEVAQSSADFDRNIKFAKYAEAGIPEAWLIDLVAERVEIHSQPTANGYGLVKMCHRGDNAASKAIPTIDLSVDEILG